MVEGGGERRRPGRERDVNTASQLTFCIFPHCSELFDVALACGLDAEWPPEETAGEQRGGGPPHAT